MKRRAFIGDIHGARAELEKLYDMLRPYKLDEIWHAGDLIDRGPDPGGVIDFCMQYGIDGVMGNHESVILEYPKKGTIPQNVDKARSLAALYEKPERLEYLKRLPWFRIFDDALLLAHAGMSSFQPFEDQRMNKREGLMWCTASLIHPQKYGETQWMEQTKKKIPEAEMREQGWVRWYEAYNQPFDMVVGHRSIHEKEMKADRVFAPNGHKIHFIDTGAWFHHNLTAFIWPDEIYVSTKLGEYRL